MSFPRYPEYKDSGVEWLGDVPTHWDVSPLKYFARVGNGSTPSREQLAYWTDGVYPWLNSSVVNQEIITESDQFVTELALGECHLPKIRPPAVLVGITGQGRTRGMAAILMIEATISQHVAYIYPDSPRVTVSWIRRVFDANYKLLRDESDGGGSTKGAITCEQISEMKFPLPPIGEQMAITAFLDRETAKIDELVAEQQRLIELLKEKREAATSHAVTKGLNPDAPMKPSGIDWLGEVPAHWEAKKLRHFSCMVQSGPFGSQLHAEEYISQGVPVINPINLVNGVIVPSDDVTVAPAVAERLAHQKLQVGDVVFSRRGELGRCALVSETERGWLCGTGSMILRLYESNYDPSYLARYLSLDVVRRYFESYSIGTIMDSLSSSTLLDLVVLIPPAREQVAIIAFFEAEARRLGALVLEAQRAIDLLQERRTALISAAVTGQIDVRAIADRAAA
ncbi:restriction endonuclease subunit S [Corallococcus carmarthensis]|uniref:restriction endonuclease subunit S n=1 Tax=Corallococcus carmarthensis TaxID=2316728 RepID=UPI00148B78E7|nr:restriction endonuclease subunit S [Corallococcus carmarthensis]NOK17304.1 hypothetical protein [Corallococcus carmarthensis]